MSQNFMRLFAILDFLLFLLPPPIPFSFLGIGWVVKAFEGGRGVVLELWCIFLFACWMGGSGLEYII